MFKPSYIPFVLAMALAATLTACGGTKDAETTTAPATPAKLSYPVARTVEQSDDYHGTKVADPYRWMENLDDAELQPWIAAENKLVSDFIADVPNRDKIKARMTELWDYARFGVPEVHGGKYFYSRNDGLQNQSPIYVQDTLDGEPRLLIDPNTLSADGTIALSETAVSPDGKLYAYSLSDGGSDWRTIKLRNVESSTDRSDEIRWAKFTNIAWTKDSSGIYYSRFDAPEGEDPLKAVNKNQKLYLHTIGTAQAEDVLVYERPDQPDWGFGAVVSDDGEFLIINGSQGTDVRNRVFYKDLSKKDGKVVGLIEELVGSFEFVGNDGNVLYFLTDDDAERNRLIAIDTAYPKKDQWRTLIAERDALLQQVSLVNGQFVANYLRDARSEVKLFDAAGQPRSDIALPGLGTATGFDGAVEDKETFFAFGSWAMPDTIYRLDLTTGTTSVFKAPTVKFDVDTYETTQVFYPSKDGTKVPMFITAKKGYVRDGNNPTILYGYGGFNIAVTPKFSPAIIEWMELGGVYAVANLRGGAEYGRSWHEGGMKLHKQNVFDDFAAGAEYLIAEKVTQPAKLAISGRSNGGLLVAATLLQRPELFGAALPAVGVLDMLRFREFTIGWAWESDYGSVQNADEFAAIHAYSPLHNIKVGTAYPPTLVTTAERDDRVFPAHSFKFAAAMQAANPDGNPVLIRIETRAGHGAGKPTSKTIEEYADIYAFLAKTLKVDVK
ncbi:MAG: S9 family peptidase [Xanthomonadales bacterium]|mgnify:FL=1|nr:S9 family peptidase [Xanthomonadales bacterium]